MGRRWASARAGRWKAKDWMPDDKDALFKVMNEIGIIGQLTTTMFEARLPDGVLVSHFSVINHMVRLGDGRTPLELARAFQVPKTTMTHTLSGLVKRGWVTMAPNPRDARSKQVFLTEAGRAFREQAIAALGPDLSEVLQRLPGDPRALLPGLTALRQVLDKMREHDG